MNVRPSHIERGAPTSAVDRAPLALLVGPLEERGGGMGRVIDYLLQASRARDLPVRFAAVDPRGRGGALASASALTVAAFRIARSGLRGDLALVHLNMAERGSTLRKGLLLLVARAVGVPTVLHLHAAQIVPFYDRLPGPGRWLVRAVFRRATACVVLGETWRRWLVDALGVEPGRIVVVRNGVPAITAGRRIAGPGEPFRFLFLGNLLERKGLADLLAALGSGALAPVSWRLTVAGGGDVERYRALAATVGIGERVSFTGWLGQSAAAEALAAADALVLPSYDEGLPLVIIEALSLGLPVVCTPVGAIPEVMRDGETALLVAPGDQDGLAEALRRVAADQELRARLSVQGRALYERSLTLDAFVDQVMEVYRVHAGIIGVREAAS